MNRSVDKRSDLYSLGVTLYELFAGVLPFVASDPLELVHCHIARMPRPPHEVNLELPAAISAIVMKLLSKAAESRYQDAGGLRADLATCRAMLESAGEISTFPLGRDDVSDDLRVPQKLYGRVEQLATLHAAFERARGGRVELLLLRGGSGTGKSALVHELNKALVREGTVVSGKFDQLNRNVPYAPIIHGCRALLRGILAQSNERLVAWKGVLASALGSNARLIVDLIPELEALLGPQPAAKEVRPAEAQQRFESTFQRFFEVFASRDHALVFFLDDLQWADAASLRLMHLVATSPSAGHLLILGAYRDNEVGPMHPLSLALAAMRSGGATVNEIELAPLDSKTMKALVEDTVGAPAGELAELMLRKTHGNPFFVRQFLTALHRRGLLRFDRTSRSWTWDVAGINASMVTDNVVDFMLRQLQELPPRSRRLLELAACIGHEFDRETLAVISDLSTTDVAAGLWSALALGLITPLDGNYRYAADSDELLAGPALNASYRFLHDRVQQTAYSLIAEQDRQTVHLEIARRLLEARGGEPHSDELFSVVDHLNMGAPLITDAGQRRELARLNLRAGLRARDAAAFAAASRLLENAVAALGADPWAAQYEVAHRAYLTRAECEFLDGRVDDAFSLLATVEKHARTPLDRVAARTIKTAALATMNRLAEATACGAESLRLLGMEIPVAGAQIGPAVAAERAVVMSELQGRELGRLVDLPAMSGAENLAIVELVSQLLPAAYQSDQALMALVVLKTTRLMLAQGNAPASPHIYLALGMFWRGAMGDARIGFELAQVAVALTERGGALSSSVAAAVHFVYAIAVSHWWRPLDEAFEHLDRGLKAGLESGDVLHLCTSATYAVTYRYYGGQPLDEIDARAQTTWALLSRKGNAVCKIWVMLIQQLLANLRGQTRSRESLSTEQCTEDDLTNLCGTNKTVLAAYLVTKTNVLYLAGAHRQAFDCANQAEALKAFIAGLLTDVDRVFYRALAAARLLGAALPDERAALLESLRQDEQTLRGWADSGPSNTAHRHALVAAELAAATGALDSACELYERAIDGAEQHGFVQHRALANELCGEFHARRGRLRLARAFTIEAHRAYLEWGATAVAAALAERHPEVVAAAGPERQPPSSISTSSTITATTHRAMGLDLMTAIRASQAIASELNPERLTERTLRSLVENAGARRGLLLGARGDALEINARLKIDPDEVETGLHEDAQASPLLPVTIVQYVARTKEVLVLGDAMADERFGRDPYVTTARPRSLLCLPMTHQGRLTGILYLENDATADAFSPDRTSLLQFLAAQAAVAMENAKLYDELHAANEGLEKRVVERTRELAERNRDMRLVLDNVDQGFLTVDRSGRLAAERSAIVDRWFGGYEGHPLFHEYIASVDEMFAQSFRVGLEAVIDDVLPQEVSIGQLPSLIRTADRTFQCTFFAISRAEALDGLLIVIDDVTERLKRAEETAGQTELLAVFQGLSRDRAGCLAFFQEGAQLVGELTAGGLDRATEKRLLHTLKGSAAMAGMSVVSGLCHRAEDELTEQGAVNATTYEQLAKRWQHVQETLETLTGAGRHVGVEISTLDLDALSSAIRGGASIADLLERLASWHWEPVERPLARLGRYAETLAKQLGKGDVIVEIDAAELRLDPARFAPLWSVMVHVIRNVVDHGLEPPELRAAGNKSPRPLVRLVAIARGHELIVEVHDDGRGIDWEAVKALAARRGLPSNTHEDLLRALLAPDFSTRERVTTTSGRGTGMAAVDEQVRALGGTVAVASQKGEGTCWRFSFASELVKS